MPQDALVPWLVEKTADQITEASSQFTQSTNIRAYESMCSKACSGHCRSDDGQASQEDEDLFACRAALLRLHYLQLLCKAPSENADLYTSLHKLVEVHLPVIQWELLVCSCCFLCLRCVLLGNQCMILVNDGLLQSLMHRAAQAALFLHLALPFAIGMYAAAAAQLANATCFIVNAL